MTELRSWQVKLFVHKGTQLYHVERGCLVTFICYGDKPDEIVVDFKGDGTDNCRIPRSSVQLIHGAPFSGVRFPTPEEIRKDDEFRQKEAEPMLVAAE